MLRFSSRQLPAPSPEHGDYERDVLRFCREWADGRETFVLHTSGSTGLPKAIALSRRQMQASARMTGEALGLQPGDSALVCLDVRYVAGTMMLVRGMELGLEMTVVEPSGNPLLTLPLETSVDFTALVPLQLQRILSQAPERLPVLQRMKAILVGGAPVSYALEVATQPIEAPVYSTYGMTETVSHVALRRLNGPDRRDTYLALPRVELGLDERKCLWVSAPSTEGKVIQTNDLAELTGAGSFRWLGRIDNVINSGGLKITPSTVEYPLDRVLTEQGLSCRFVVFGLPDAVLGEKLCVALESHPLSPLDEKRVRQQLATLVRRYEMPKHFFYWPAFPETPTGKIDRPRIVQQFVQQVSDQQ